MATDEKEAFEGWGILELMGHRRLGGYMREVELFGVVMCRIDIPAEPPVTQFYGGSAVYCCTPVTEEMARAVAAREQPEPVHRWELPHRIVVLPGPQDEYDPMDRTDDEDDETPF